ncbi:MAG TPA: type 4a pilus biogenesis protein PilO, partial [Candidatus Paceibacterota bacterium]|nr:type 4a pilus biogenesis protein PilO [Candidatus Paceibacterota bacterium]
DQVQVVQSNIDEYNQALDKVQQLQTLKQTLLSRYNSFSPDDITRLQTMLPTQVDNIGLILDLDTLANKYGMTLQNVVINSPTDQSGTVGADSVMSSSTPSALLVSFSLQGTYSQLQQYLTALQQSLRIVDLVKLDIGGGAGEANNNSGSGSTPANTGYKFDITLQTYWLP